MPAITATIISVLGTGFISVLVYAMCIVSAKLDRLDYRITSQINGIHGLLGGLRKEMHRGFKEHGERLDRIEVQPSRPPTATKPAFHRDHRVPHRQVQTRRSQSRQPRLRPRLRHPHPPPRPLTPPQPHRTPPLSRF